MVLFRFFFFFVRVRRVQSDFNEGVYIHEDRLYKLFFVRCACLLRTTIIIYIYKLLYVHANLYNN